MKCRMSLILALILSLLLIGCASQQVTMLPDVRGETWDYVVLGSSIGTWWARCYGELMKSDLGVKIVYHDYYVASQWVSALLHNVKTKERLREDIRNAEVITIGVGSADMFPAIQDHFALELIDQRELDETVEEFRETYNSLLSEVVSIASPTDTYIRIMNIYFPFVGRYKEEGKYSSVKQYWMKFNECIRQAGRRHSIPVAHVFEAFNGPRGGDDPADKGYIDYDGRHSSEKGMKLIAEEFHKLGYQHASK